MVPKTGLRLRLRFSVRALLIMVALISVCLAFIARPVYVRKRFISWTEQNGGRVERFDKPEPIVIDLGGGLKIERISYQRVLGPEQEPEIPQWRKWLGDLPVNTVMLPLNSNDSDVEYAKSLFPEAEVLVMEEPGTGGFF